MRNEIRVASTTTQNDATKCLSNAAKVTNEKDICKVWRYFSLYVGTTLDAAHATGILRNSITYYVAELEQQDMLQAIYKRPDSTTGYMAKHYSADRSLWKRDVPQQLELFDVPSIGEVLQDLAHAPIKDTRSEYCNIFALLQKRKESQNEQR